LIYLKIVFIILVLLELRYKKFKTPKELILWVFLVGIFSWLGYILFLVFRKRLLVRRDRFNLEFKKRNQNTLDN